MQEESCASAYFKCHVIFVWNVYLPYNAFRVHFCKAFVASAFKTILHLISLSIDLLRVVGKIMALWEMNEIFKSAVLTEIYSGYALTLVYSGAKLFINPLNTLKSDPVWLKTTSFLTQPTLIWRVSGVVIHKNQYVWIPLIWCLVWVSIFVMELSVNE